MSVLGQFLEIVVAWLIVGGMIGAILFVILVLGTRRR